MKLNPEAFLWLARFHAKNYYDDPDSVRLRKSRVVLAAAGSGFNVPLTPENLAVYGDTPKRGGKGRPQMGFSCLFDVVNRMIVDAGVGESKLNEREEALRHIDRAKEIIGEKPCVYLFDRGCPSGEMFLDLNERGISYAFRLGSSHFRREQREMAGGGATVGIIFDKPRLSPKRPESRQKLEKAGSVAIRFVHIKLENGADEYLAANLPKEEFTSDDISYLYHMGWGMETAFDGLKNKLQIENFTGKKPVAMEQDAYATVYLSNAINGIANDAEPEITEDARAAYKHGMKANRALAAGIVKESLIVFLPEKDADKKRLIMDTIVREINSNLLPVRSNRHFPRSAGTLASKFNNTHKRVF
jgi:hypothetical protein